MRLPRAAGALVALGLALAAAIAIVAGLAGGDGHTLRAAFQSAVNVVPGEEVRIAGRKVGEVGSVEEIDGDAVVELDLGEEAWPLHRGTTARLRYGSLSGYAARYVALDPGPASAPALSDGGILTTASTITPIEFDQIFNTFKRPTRSDIRGLLANAAGTLDGRGDDLASGITRGSTGLARLADLMRDLGADPDALGRLVRAGARTAAALRSRDPELRGLLDHAAATFDELAEHARAQQDALERFPGALRGGRRTLGRLDQSLVGLSGLVAELRPGARGLRRIAPSVRRMTKALFEIAPLATETLTVGERAAPDIDRFLRRGAPFMPRLASVVGQLAPMVACLRPYGPEIAGWSATWLSAGGTGDYPVPYGRTLLNQPPPGLQVGTGLSAEQAVAAHRGRVFYAMPRPPGLNVDQPWFQPQCGAGRGALDPSTDPEARGGG